MVKLSQLIGKQIHAIRKRSALTQEQVADRIAAKQGKEGYNKSRISNIETAKENITLESLEEIITALGVSPYEFFDFRKYQESLDYEDKKLIVDEHQYMLMERPIEEVRYIVRTAKDFIRTVDGDVEP